MAEKLMIFNKILRKCEILPCAPTWKEIGSMMLSETNLKEKDK